MTLVASIAPNDCPILVGDVLLTGREVSNREAVLPTVGNGSKAVPPGSGRAIVGLRQKIAIPSENCVIGWSGSAIAAELFFDRLTEAVRESKLTFDQIVEVDKELEPDVKNLGLEFVGWLYEAKAEGFRRVVSTGATTLETKSLGKVDIVGSGSEYFCQLAGLLDSSAPSEPVDEKNCWQDAVMKAIGSAGFMLKTELRGFATLRHFFGGAFEVAAFDGLRFFKVRDITFVFWKLVKKDGVIAGAVPVMVIKQDYVGDLLILRKADFGSDSWGAVARVREVSMHAIEPALKRQSRDSLPKVQVPDLNSKYTCNIVMAQVDSEFVSFTHVEHQPDLASRVIFFEESKGAIELRISREFVNLLLEGFSNSQMRTQESERSQA